VYHRRGGGTKFAPVNIDARWIDSTIRMER
jgi:hypothetical protein